MAASSDHEHSIEAITKAFSGHGVDEKALISILGKWNPEERQKYRKGSLDFFVEDERQFERWNDAHILHLHHQFLRLKNAIVLWTMHPWERDARLLKETLSKGTVQYINVRLVVEIACTRSSDELLGARKAYHSLFDRSIEEDVAFHVHGPQRELLVGLVSSYRYEGPKVNEEIAKSEAKALSNSIKVNGGKDLIGDAELLRVVSTRSKLHLIQLYKYYKEISGSYLDEDLDDLILKDTVQCLCTPETYFSKVLEACLERDSVDEISKEGVSRVIITRADVDMKQIKEEYNDKYGVSLANKIEDVANGNYRDFLLTLIARSGDHN